MYSLRMTMMFYNKKGQILKCLYREKRDASLSLCEKFKKDKKQTQEMLETNEFFWRKYGWRERERERDGCRVVCEG